MYGKKQHNNKQMGKITQYYRACVSVCACVRACVRAYVCEAAGGGDPTVTGRRKHTHIIQK